MKYTFITVFVSLISSPAFACSCSPWQEGLVSDFVANYTSFWGVPVKASLIPRSTDRPGLILAYEVEIMEDFNRIGKDSIQIIANIPDGGNCGRELDMGTPQFISAYNRGDGQFLIGTCTPEMPYGALKSYLETGEDRIIPDLYECKEAHDLQETVLDCDVWNDVLKSGWRSSNSEDGFNYLKLWRAKQRASASIP